MATGDLFNNLERLRSELNVVKYDGEYDLGYLGEGHPAGTVPILRYILLRFSRTLSEYIVNMGHELYTKDDERLVRCAFRVARDVLDYHPRLTEAHFLASGHAERKAIFLADFVQLCRRKHNELVQQSLQANRKVRVSSTPGKYVHQQPANITEVRVVSQPGQSISNSNSIESHSFSVYSAKSSAGDGESISHTAQSGQDLLEKQLRDKYRHSPTVFEDRIPMNHELHRHSEHVSFQDDRGDGERSTVHFNQEGGPHAQGTDDDEDRWTDTQGDPVTYGDEDDALGEHLRMMEGRINTAILNLNARMQLIEQRVSRLERPHARQPTDPGSGTHSVASKSEPRSGMRVSHDESLYLSPVPNASAQTSVLRLMTAPNSESSDKTQQQERSHVQLPLPDEADSFVSNLLKRFEATEALIAEAQRSMQPSNAPAEK